MVKFYDNEFQSRLLIGTALYPSPAIMQSAIRAAGSEIVTVSLRREAAGGKTGDAFWSLIRELERSRRCPTPPAACACARRVTTGQAGARTYLATSWTKLRRRSPTTTRRQPDVVGLVEAADILTRRPPSRYFPLLHRVDLVRRDA